MYTERPLLYSSINMFIMRTIEKGQLVHTKNPLAFFVYAKLGVGSGI